MKNRVIAAAPPMGWNSWDCYGAAVTEEQVLENARYMQKHLKPFGYEYVVVDIEWYQPTANSHEYQPFAPLCMDSYRRLVPAKNRFPSAKDSKGDGAPGFRPLAEKIHAMGLKFGIHIMRGIPREAAVKHLPILGTSFTADQAADPSSICAWNPDMYGLQCETNGEAALAYYKSIFALYASWGVDFVKCDDIAREYPRCRREIELISEASRTCGRDIVLSLSPGPAPIDEAEHLKTFANMWRITDDFWDDWVLLKAMFERAEKWCIHAGPGHWPDADMLPVGALKQDYDKNNRTKFTQAEQRTMMSLWCMMRSPLIIGADLPKLDPFTLNLLTNKEVLEIEKKSFCAHPLYRTDTECVWIAPAKDGTSLYLALFNLGDTDRTIQLSLGDAELSGYRTAKELWSGATTNLDEEIRWDVPMHDAAVFRLTR